MTKRCASRDSVVGGRFVPCRKKNGHKGVHRWFHITWKNKRKA